MPVLCAAGPPGGAARRGRAGPGLPGTAPWSWPVRASGQLVMEVGDAAFRIVLEDDLDPGARRQLSRRVGHVVQVQPAYEVHHGRADSVQPHVGNGVGWRRQVVELNADDGGRFDNAFLPGFGPTIARLEGTL